MKFTAAGDCAIQRFLAEYDGIDEVKSFIARGDARFFNLETTVNRDCYANYYSGGTWLRTDRRVLSSLDKFGFNLTTGANNHCTDYGNEGLLQTIDAITDAGYVHAGLGRNLREASMPRYLDTPNGRVALIACSSSFKPGALAGEQSRLLPGRPGINGIRVKETLIIDEGDIDVLKRIAEKTGVNISNDADRATGYLPEIPEGSFDLGNMHFTVGKDHGLKYEIESRDLERLDKAIEEAKFFADYVLISFHSHDRQYEDIHKPAAYIEEFARHCIDLGAHAFIGHGPHLIRPIEIYKQRPIFYSLGDFLLQLENCELAPEDFYAKFGLSSDSSMYELFKLRTKNFTCGLQRDEIMMTAIIPYFEMENGELKALELLPIELGYGMKHSEIGLPRVANDDSILKLMAKISESYGTKFEMIDGKARLIL